MTALSQLTRVVRDLWETDRPLTAVGLLMLAALAATGLGLVLDPRTIGGAPAWLKPAKFAASTAIYTLTLAWIFKALPAWPRTRTIVGWTTAAVFVLEVAIIDVQAWRGTTSHFNVGTSLDATLFAIMGLAIFVQTIVSVTVAVALWRQPFTDRTMGTALRAGMVITLLGAASAGLMTVPTSAQLANLESSHRLETSGAHTVGAPDGGPGLPGTGWSREHGDLRIPHFVGLHAMQVLPVLALLLRRRLGDEEARRLTRMAAVSYSALFGVLLLQALRGEALLSPSAGTTAVFVSWALATAVIATATRLYTARDPFTHSVGA